MHIRYGFDIEMEFLQPTSLITALDVHPSQRDSIVHESGFSAMPRQPVNTFIDGFGNLCRQVEAPAGVFTLRNEGIIDDSGAPDVANWSADAMPISALPKDVIGYLLGSRYCETDLLSAFAWQNFGHIQGGWARVQAVVDFVHQHLTFGYQYARNTRTALQAFEERVGVCRDFTHLAVTLCRCLNIPTRYCNGYLGDIGVPFDPAPMDFNAWFQAYLGGQWYTFDARHNQPRIGRILIACGRDAADIAMISSFGPHLLTRFNVITEEVPEPRIELAA
jgi:transglutaminase-like putative cysteine protease